MKSILLFVVFAMPLRALATAPTYSESYLEMSSPGVSPDDCSSLDDHFVTTPLEKNLKDILQRNHVWQEWGPGGYFFSKNGVCTTTRFVLGSEESLLGFEAAVRAAFPAFAVKARRVEVTNVGRLRFSRKRDGLDLDLNYESATSFDPWTFARLMHWTYWSEKDSEYHSVLSDAGFPLWLEQAAIPAPYRTRLDDFFRTQRCLIPDSGMSWGVEARDISFRLADGQVLQFPGYSIINVPVAAPNFPNFHLCVR